MRSPLGSCYRMIRPLLFQLDAELAHRLTLATLQRLPAFAPRDDPSELRVKALGLEFSNPIGLAAGMDKDGRALRAWNALGFGFAEIGTVTPAPQPGHPRPRMWRLPEHRGLINRLGFPSEGLEAVAARIEQLRQPPSRLRLALNIGPNKETPPDRVPDDYATLARRVAPLADFLVINVSSPNTPGLRGFQTPERLRAIVVAMRDAMADQPRRPPLLVKIAPDLEPAAIDDLCATFLELRVDGIVATNTTLRRDELGVRTELAGGLSGEPLKMLARGVITRAFRSIGGRIPIIGVGGIASAQDAYDHIRAGASLVELYTAMIYEGPGIVRAIKDGLTPLLARDGFRSISEAVGTLEAH